MVAGTDGLGIATGSTPTRFEYVFDRFGAPAPSARCGSRAALLIAAQARLAPPAMHRDPQKPLRAPILALVKPKPTAIRQLAGGDLLDLPDRHPVDRAHGIHPCGPGHGETRSGKMSSQDQHLCSAVKTLRHHRSTMIRKAWCMLCTPPTSFFPRRHPFYAAAPALLIQLRERIVDGASHARITCSAALNWTFPGLDAVVLRSM